MAMLFLVGCGANNDGPARLENYAQRLARANDRDLPPLLPINLPRVSQAQLKRLPVAPLKIDLIDFLALSGCQLQVNIGRRNSALGRVASASQQLLLDLEFLELAPACIQHLRKQDEHNLATVLEQARQQRQQTLANQLYNAILAGTEWRQFWAIPQALGAYPDNINGDPIDAIFALADASQRWLSGDYEADNLVFEGHLATVRGGDGGALLLAASTVGSRLTQTNGLLTRDAEQPLCGNNRAPERVRVSERVISQFFIAEVQPWITQVNRRNQDLLVALEQLEQALDEVIPTEYRQWQSRRDALLRVLSSASRQHVAQLKQYFAGCPGALWEATRPSAQT